MKDLKLKLIEAKLTGKVPRVFNTPGTEMALRQLGFLKDLRSDQLRDRMASVGRYPLLIRDPDGSELRLMYWPTVR